jgi:hypothetical protein
LRHSFHELFVEHLRCPLLIPFYGVPVRIVAEPPEHGTVLDLDARAIELLMICFGWADPLTLDEHADFLMPDVWVVRHPEILNRCRRVGKPIIKSGCLEDAGRVPADRRAGSRLTDRNAVTSGA